MYTFLLMSCVAVEELKEFIPAHTSTSEVEDTVEYADTGSIEIPLSDKTVGCTYSQYHSLHEAIAANTDYIYICSGQYHEPILIENRGDLIIEGGIRVEFDSSITIVDSIISIKNISFSRGVELSTFRNSIIEASNFRYEKMMAPIHVLNSEFYCHQCIFKTNTTLETSAILLDS